MKILGGDAIITDDIKDRTKETLTDLQTLLGDHDWVAHTPNYTIADIFLLSTIENIEVSDRKLKQKLWMQRLCFL